mmetsp:Transcript_31004/g.68090  ORF Transcript_31004/g.68090 Transcript_31004/m.68090 type:complete len:455 (+) Transcript_31004:143-1507(+)
MGLMLKAVVVLFTAAVGLRLARDASNTTVEANSSQPFPRCMFSPCVGFGEECQTDNDCVTNKCFENKCAMTASCRKPLAPCANGKGDCAQTCKMYAPHTCCTGKCNPVEMRTDCLRLLGYSVDILKRPIGVNIDRQCADLGVCAPWDAGSDTGRITVPATPWAVSPMDAPSKYKNYAALTFSADAQLLKKYSHRWQPGRRIKDLDPATQQPGAIADAGVIEFAPESTIATELFSRYYDGQQYYCIAPVVREAQENGQLLKHGGGYFAVGKACCEGKWNCGKKEWKEGIVVAPDGPALEQARTLNDIEHGIEFHGLGLGMTTKQPVYVDMTENATMVLKKGRTAFKYPASEPDQVEHCVAPIVSVGFVPGLEGAAGEVKYWAVGTDCCSDGKFSCGTPAKKGDTEPVFSGIPVADSGKNFMKAVRAAEVEFGVRSHPQPMFVDWVGGRMFYQPPR